MSRTTKTTRPNKEERERLPTKNGVIQVFFANAVRRGPDGEILRHEDSDEPKKGHYGLIHNDSFGCENPTECREKKHVVYVSATVILKALGLRRGTPISFGSRTNEDGKESAVFVRFADRDSGKTIRADVTHSR